MSETTFQVGDKVTILDVKKVGEVVEVFNGGLYKVEYTDDGGVVQTETCDATARRARRSIRRRRQRRRRVVFSKTGNSKRQRRMCCK